MKKIICTFFVLSVLFSGCKKEDDNSTCSDGIKNGTETGIDCGGSCTACGSIPTCSDGIQNQGETGIDCGGPCTACQVSPCQNGILDGTETFVDCGGSCAACPTIFINGQLDGVPFHYSNLSQSGAQDGSFDYWGSNNSTFDAGGVILGGGEVEMYQGRINNTSYPTSSEYYDLYAPGTYSFYNVNNMTATHGASVGVFDVNDVWWSTYGMSNTGNTITITSRSTWTPGSSYIIFKGNFSCDVRSMDSVGITKTLSGSFSMYGYVKPF